LATHAGVATVPGEAFFIDGDEIVIRIPISVSKDELNLGLNKILNSLISKK
jgi:aspartate/methionine/tyrosine aminotransferase